MRYNIILLISFYEKSLIKISGVLHVHETTSEIPITHLTMQTTDIIVIYGTDFKNRKTGKTFKPSKRITLRSLL